MGSGVGQTVPVGVGSPLLQAITSTRTTMGTRRMTTSWKLAPSRRYERADHLVRSVMYPAHAAMIWVAVASAAARFEARYVWHADSDSPHTVFAAAGGFPIG